MVRPHTAGATANAARDAMLLTEVLAKADSKNLDEPLRVFEDEQIRYGQELHQYGVALGNRWANP